MKLKPKNKKINKILNICKYRNIGQNIFKIARYLKNDNTSHC